MRRSADGGTLTTAAHRAARIGWVGNGAAAEAHYRTITALKLRAKPSGSGKVLLVMPYGSPVKFIGSTRNGYTHVEFEGTEGWAFQELIISTTADSWPLMTVAGTTTKKARIRAYPVPEANTLSMVAKGTEIQISDKVVDGYRFVAYDGAKGWMLDSAIGDFVDGIHPGQHLVTTANVNAREQPNTSAKILHVLPAGTEVVATGYNENGFADVSFEGGGGWVSMDYLAKL